MLGGAAFVLPEPAASQDDRLDPAELEGAWILASRSAEATIDAAITRVTDQMDLIARPIAQSRIDDAVNPEHRIAFDGDAEAIRITLDDWGPVEVHPGGPARRVRASDGTPLTVRARLRAECLVLQQRAEDGARVSFFSPDGERLTMVARVQSEQLPRDIVYRLPYRRAGRR
ncbi:MAG: hypothetical protein AB7S26_32745 [Sandaracinaceae bacterium]